MNEFTINWQVLIALVFLLGILAAIVKAAFSIGKPIVKLNTTLTTLDLTIKSLQEQLKTFRGDNDKDHEEIFDRLDGHEDTLVEHDKAILELRMAAPLHESKR